MPTLEAPAIVAKIPHLWNQLQGGRVYSDHGGPRPRGLEVD